MLINQIKKHSTIFFKLGIFIFPIGILLPFNIRNVAVILLGIFLLINISNIRRVNKLALINCLYYIIIVLSLIYTTDFDIGKKLALVMLPIFILSISFSLFFKKENINYDKWFNIISITFFLSTVVFFIGLITHNLLNGFVNENIFIHFGERLNSKFGKYSIHPIYASLNVSIALIISLSLINSAKSLKFKIILIIMDLFLILILLLLARKGPIIITLLLLILIHFFQNRNVKNVFIYIFLIIIIITIMINIIPLRNRFLELVSNLTSYSSNNFGSTFIRLNIYDCSIEAIKNSPIFGYGIGDVENVLQQCYTLKASIFNGRTYNSHNQFLSAWLSAGILGIVSLLALFFYNFKKAFKSKDLAYTSVLTLFFFMMLTENILDRQNGVLLFAFFINLFAFKNTKQLST